jgi:hypothetical protein
VDGLAVVEGVERRRRVAAARMLQFKGLGSGGCSIVVGAQLPSRALLQEVALASECGGGHRRPVPDFGSRGHGPRSLTPPAHQTKLSPPVRRFRPGSRKARA